MKYPQIKSLSLLLSMHFRIRDKAANNEMFSEDDIMDMFIQVCMGPQPEPH